MNIFLVADSLLDECIIENIHFAFIYNCCEYLEPLILFDIIR